MIEELNKYLQKNLGAGIALNASKVIQGKLPLSLSQRYSVYMSEMFGHQVCFAVDNDATTPFGYEKEIKLIKRIASVPVVIVGGNINPVDVHRMIQRRIDFIVPGKRMFMPSLMIDLDGRYAGKIPDVIPPLSQMIILYHLQKGNLNGLDAKSVAEKFGVTYLTASRALKWIGDKITPLKKDGRRCMLEFPEPRKLLSYAKPFLRNPVFKRIPTDDLLAQVDGILAGESALEEYSMIAASGECKAVSKGTEFDVIPDVRGLNSIELWMYDPGILAESGVCDRISLILSLSDNADERIRKEIGKLKSEIEW